MSTDEIPLPIIEPVAAPESVGEEAAAMKATSPRILTNFSFTNLVTEIKNMKYMLHLCGSIHLIDIIIIWFLLIANIMCALIGYFQDNILP